MIRLRWILLTTVLAGLGVCAAAQTPVPAGTASLAGRVVDARTNTAIAGAIVTLNGHGAPDRVLTDATGRFSFLNLPAGTFGLFATKPGFAALGFGQHHPWDLAAPIAIAHADHRADVTIALSRLGAIGGVVTNDAGDPLANVFVEVLRRTLLGGRWQMLPGASVTTDDRGRYRVSGLDAATYVVAVRPDLDVETPLLLALLSDNPASAADIMAGVTAAEREPDVDAAVEHDAPAFYATGGARMTPIDLTLSPNGERANVNVRLTRARTVRVAGRVNGRAEVMESIEGLTIRLVPADVTGRAPIAEFEFASAACDETGRFAFSAVPPGRYVLEAVRAASPAPGAQANAPLPASPTLWARAPILVRAGIPIVDAVLHVDTGRVVSGRIELSNGGAPIDLSTIAARLDAMDAPLAGAPMTWPGRVGSDGRLSMTDVPPGRYVLRLTNLPRGLTLHSARTSGRDILDEPIAIADADVSDVTISLGTTPLGTITGHSDPHDVVLVFSQTATAQLDTTAQARRTRRVRPSPDGTFTIAGLPGGDYFAAAIGGDMPVDWQSPDRLRLVAAHASHVHVANGETTTIDPAVIK